MPLALYQQTRMNSVEKLADSTTMESYIVVLYRNPWYYLAAAVCAITSCTRPTAGWLGAERISAIAHRRNTRC